MTGLIIFIAAIVTLIAITELLMPTKKYDESDRVRERAQMWHDRTDSPH